MTTLPTPFDPAIARARRALAGLGRLLARSAGARDLTLAAALGTVLAIATTMTMQDPRPELRIEPKLSSIEMPACDAPNTAITLDWEVDTAVHPAAVTGIRLGDVPAGCAAQPITITLSDGDAAVLATVTNPPTETTGDYTTLAFAFATPVPIPPIEAFRAEVPDPVGTPVPVQTGTDVAVSFVDPTSGVSSVVTFGSVDTAGTVTVTTLAPDAPGYVAPSGFSLSSPAVFFDLSTTVDYTPPVTVCIFYPLTSDPSGDPALFHYASATSTWENVTTSWDAATGRLCGAVDDLSPFAVGTVGSATVSQQVSAPAIAYGDLITDIVTVRGMRATAGGYVDPTGSVTLSYCYSANAPIAECTTGTAITGGTIALDGGTALDGYATATLADWLPPQGLGYYRFRAAYSGDSDYEAATDGTGPNASFQVVRSETTTAIVSDASAGSGGTSTAVYGQQIRFTATVTSPHGAQPVGTVKFYHRNNLTTSYVGECTLPVVGYGLAALTSASCSITTSELSTIGLHWATAEYVPGTSFLASSSDPLKLNVLRAATATELTTTAAAGMSGSGYSASSGELVRFTARVLPVAPATGAPTGTVNFLDNGKRFATCTLTAPMGGVCTVETSRLSTATHAISAAYAGDANFLTSTSSPLALAVGAKTATTTTLALSATTAAYGQPVSFTVSVGPTVAVTRVPSGTVTILDAGKAVGSCKLPTIASGTPSCTVTLKTLKVGDHSITASYGGDAWFAASATPTTAKLSIVRAATATTIASSPTSPKAPALLVLTATVTPTTLVTEAPTGYVRFFDGAKSLGFCLLSRGTCSITTNVTSKGLRTYSATYDGDTAFRPSSASMSLQAR